MVERKEINSLLEKVADADNRELLQRWITEAALNSRSEKYIKNYGWNYAKVLNEFGISWKQITRKEVERWVATEKPTRCYKVLLKMLMRFAYQTIGGYPEAVAWLKTNKTLNDKSNPKNYDISTDEYLSVLDSCHSQETRLLVALLFDNPLRPKDVENLSIGDFSPDSNGHYQVKLHSKTEDGERVVQSVYASPEIRAMLIKHPNKNDPKAPVFVSKKGNRMSYDGLCYNYNKAMRLAYKQGKIKRNITMYDFRRTVSTTRSQDPNYPPMLLKTEAGWKTLQMLNVYAKHIKTSNVCKNRLMSEGIIPREQNGEKKELIKAQPLKCPNCSADNQIGSISCERCGLPFKLPQVRRNVVNALVDNGKPLTMEAVKQVVREMLEKGEIDNGVVQYSKTATDL
jgi:integrase